MDRRRLDHRLPPLVRLALASGLALVWIAALTASLDAVRRSRSTDTSPSARADEHAALAVARAPAAQDPPTVTAIARLVATSTVTATVTATLTATPDPSQPTEPTPTPSPGTPAGPLPDLRVSGTVSIFGPGANVFCTLPGWRWWTDGTVWNDGDAAAGAFVVRASNGISWTVAGLAVGERAHLPKQPASAEEIIADADEQVVESDEGNNRSRIPIPTLPLPCTPTPAPFEGLLLPFALRPSGRVQPSAEPTTGPIATPSPQSSTTVEPTASPTLPPPSPTLRPGEASPTPELTTPPPPTDVPSPTPSGPLAVCPVVALGWRAVEVIVVDGSGTPLEGAVVSCLQASDYPSEGSCAPYEVTTGAGGRFAFDAFLHPGDWVRLLVWREGYWMQSANVAAASCAEACPEVTFELQGIDETPEPTATLALWPTGTAPAYPRSDCVTATPIGGTPHFPRATPEP